MSKYYFLFIVLFALFCTPISSQTVLKSDTIILKTGVQQVAFELPDTSFQSLHFYVYIQLNENCHFNTGEFLSLKMENQYNSEEVSIVEFARVYLPSYMEHPTANNEIIYDFDLSLWQSWLRKNATISIAFYGEANEIKTSFAFHMEKGETTVDVINIIPLWQSDLDGFSYDENGVNKEEFIPTKAIQLPENTHSAFVNIIVSGIKQSNEEEIAAGRFYFLKINGQDMAKRNIWRDDCGYNPIFPQNDNWHMERPNWCPGLKVNPLSHLLDEKWIEKGQFEIDLDFQKDFWKTSGIRSYVTSAVLFTLAKPNEKLNVSISEIVAPSIDLWHHRYNPICGSPIILVQNNGQETVKTITINYGYNFETDNKYRWKGELGFMEVELVYLPPLNWYFYDKNDEPETFTAHISAVNGSEKAFVGGKKTSVMELASVFPYRLVFELHTDDGAAYNFLEIYNDDGEAYFLSGELKNDTAYHFNVNLTPGCYEMILYDEEGNGINWDDGNISFFRILDRKKGIILKEFDGDFGSEIREQFMIFR